MKTLFFISSVLLTALFSSAHAVPNNRSYSCDSPIFCEGPILKAVQMAGLFSDSKTFVDMPTKKPEVEVLKAFEKINGANASRADIKQFLEDNFMPAGTEVTPLHNINIPKLDWIDDISNPDYRGWAEHLNEAWGNLTVTFDYSNLCHGCVTSALPVNRPFVVPGGRFREFYYWDSFFVIKGLILSKQFKLAEDMIENFFDFIEEYGFVPNGARIYYLNRSQPPFLAHMIDVYYEETGDKDFLLKALPILEKEYHHWMRDRSIEVTNPRNDNVYTLNHYAVNNKYPRPESYVQDFNTVNTGTDFSDEEKEQLYADIAAGAETGWDFSSRWTRQKQPSPDQVENYEMLRTINTANIIPIDLNSLLWYYERQLSTWYSMFHRKSKEFKKKSIYYRQQAKKRLDAMEELMWNDDFNSFYDFNLTSNEQNVEYTPATLYPIWVGAFPEKFMKDKTTLSKVFDQTEEALQKYPGILTTSYYNTTLQWDWPNGWPPLTYIAIQSLRQVELLLNSERNSNDSNIVASTSQGTSFNVLSTVLAERYAASAFCGWINTGGSIPGVLEKLNSSTEDAGHMFEKFDVNTIGLSGSQGEYVSQIGFGWTNAVALWVLNLWPNFTAPDCTQTIVYDF
ncbi:trehalase [Mycotypha africana]|uniref:trehalase n=1 Tax=Mycotypha africana TaxID=64632 RepID=UPI00230051BF|nr:trehalase [Mycotypha africana]KAI8984171.1 trehalase [Mycotypha africana]